MRELILLLLISAWVSCGGCGTATTPAANLQNHAPATTQATRSDVPQLHVVHTWGELASQPRVDIGDGQFVRLGISADRAPLNAGAVIYCLSDGFDALRGHMINGDSLGPVFVSVKCGSVSFDHATPDCDMIPRWEWQTAKGCTLFFEHPVLVDRSGRYDIAIRTNKGAIVARSAIVSDSSFYQPWTPIAEESKEQWELDDRAKYTLKQTQLAKLSVPGAGIAMPGIEGFDFTVVEGTDNGWNGTEVHEKPREDAPITPWVPTVPELKLSIEGNRWRLDSATSAKETNGYCSLLARWWVNNLPFVPKQSSKPAELRWLQLRDQPSIQFDLQLDPAVLGTKPGDVVSVQLLKCYVWFPVQNPKTDMAGNGAVSVSNRVDFAVK